MRETFETDFGSVELEHWNPRKGSGLEVKVGKSLSGVGGVQTKVLNELVQEETID